MGAEGAYGDGVGAGGDGGVADEWFKCLNCDMEEGLFNKKFIKKHKAVHKEERKKALENKLKQEAARKKAAAARGKASKKKDKGGKPGKKGGKGSSRKKGSRDKRCNSK